VAYESGCNVNLRFKKKTVDQISASQATGYSRVQTLDIRSSVTVQFGACLIITTLTRDSMPLDSDPTVEHLRVS
jgi:hypothetical protein